MHVHVQPVYLMPWLLLECLCAGHSSLCPRVCVLHRKYYDLDAWTRYQAQKAAYKNAKAAGAKAGGGDAVFDARADEEAIKRARIEERVAAQQARLSEAYHLLKHTDRAKDMREQEVRIGECATPAYAVPPAPSLPRCSASAHRAAPGPNSLSSTPPPPHVGAAAPCGDGPRLQDGRPRARGEDLQQAFA